MSTAVRPLCSPSTGDTAMLALLPGLVVVDLGDRVCGEEAALRDALRRLDDVLRCSISSRGSGKEDVSREERSSDKERFLKYEERK